MIFMGFIDAGNLNIKSLKLVEKLQKRIQKNHRIGVSPDLKIKLVEKYKHWHYHWAKEIEVLKTKMMSRKILIFTLVASVFLIARLPAVHQIYHQDEYKWAMQADPIDNESPHLPLGKYTLRLTGDILGFENLRFAPLLFSFLSLALIYLIIKNLPIKQKLPFWEQPYFP